MKKPLHQKLIELFSYLLIGVFAIGTFLDAISNAISLINIKVAITVTIIFVITISILMYLIKKNKIKWVTNSGHQTTIKSLSPKLKISLFGGLLLMWIPILIDSFKERDNTVISKESQITQDTIIRISTNDSLKRIGLQNNILKNNKNLSPQPNFNEKIVFGRSGFMGRGEYSFSEESKLELQVNGFLRQDCMAADGCSNISIVSSGENSAFVIDSLYIKLHGYAKCDLRNEKSTITGYMGTPNYQFYISKNHSIYPIIPIQKIGETGKWILKGNDYEEYFIKFFYEPYTLYIISFELRGRNVNKNKKVSFSTPFYSLIFVENGNSGGCLELDKWFDENSIIKPSNTSYKENLSTSQYQILISDLREDNALIGNYNKGLLKMDIELLKQYNKKNKQNPVLNWTLELLSRMTNLD